MSDHLGPNLKLLCSHYRSIAEVCRKLAINRAQFNKYLSGQSRPTAYNLKRICDFFGVEAYELSLPAEQFADLIGALYDGASEIYTETEVTYEDGRKGAIKATLRIEDVPVFGEAPMQKVAAE